MTSPQDNDFAELLREVTNDFLDDASAGQFAAFGAAVKRAVFSEKAAPLRALVAEVDDLHGNLFSKAFRAVANRNRSSK